MEVHVVMTPEVRNNRYDVLVNDMQATLLRKMRLEAALRMAQIEGNRRAERDNSLKMAVLLDEIDLACVDISRGWGTGLLNRIRREADERAKFAFAKEQAKWGAASDDFAGEE